MRIRLNQWIKKQATTSYQSLIEDPDFYSGILLLILSYIDLFIFSQPRINKSFIIAMCTFKYRIIIFFASISRFSPLLYICTKVGSCIKILQVRLKNFCKLCRIPNKSFFLKTFQVLIKLIMMFLIHWGYALLCLGICLLIYWYVF